MSLSRLMVVMHPMDTRFKMKGFIWNCILFLVTLTFFFTSVFSLVSHFVMKEVPMSLCSPFIDLTGNNIPINVATFAVTTYQIAAIIFMSITYSLLIKELRKSQSNMAELTGRKINNFWLIFQLFCVILTNIVCWIPTDAVYLMSVFKPQYPILLVVLITIVLMPLNSVINPIIFMVSTKRSSG